MLHKSTKKELKQIINQQLEEITSSIIALQNMQQPVSPDNAIGRLSRMDALEMQSVNTVKLQKQQHRASQLKQALSKLEHSEDFGVCLECAEQINLNRLKVKPESQYCVTCQGILDRG